MDARLISTIATCLLITAAAFAAQPAGAKSFPIENVASLQDRTDLQSQASELADAFEAVSAVTLQDLKKEATAHAAERLATLRSSTGQSQQTLSVFDDLMRFPRPNRGEPVQLVGVLRDVEVVTLSGTDVQFVVASPVENPEARIAILAPVGTAVPQAATKVAVAGVFAKLVELPGGSGSSPTMVAPLLIAPAAPEAVQERDALEPALWSVVRHRTLGVLPAEKDLYYRVLRQAADAGEQVLEAAARDQLQQRKQDAPERLRKQVPFPTFVDLFKHPEAYEGKPVTLKGHAREIRTYPAGDNAEGLDTLYEAWVYTEDSESNPAVIVASSASADLPIGDDLQVPVEGTGYFFKIYAYHAQDTARVAPMVLAGRIEKLPEPRLAGPAIWMLITIGAVVALLFGWLLVSYVGTRRKRASVGEIPPDFGSIDEQ